VVLSSLCTLMKSCARKSTTRLDSHGPSDYVRSMAQTERTAAVIREELYKTEQAIQAADLAGQKHNVRALRRKANKLSEELHKKES